MKGVSIQVQNEIIGKQFLFTETAETYKFAQIMAAGQSEPLKICDLFFGFNKELYQDMFLPKEKVFMNEIVDLVIENQRFISFPYYFPGSDAFEKARKNLVKLDHKTNFKNSETTTLGANIKSADAGFNGRYWRADDLYSRGQHIDRDPRIQRHARLRQLQQGSHRTHPRDR